ncbi:MAG: cytidylyltransferase domain-containing protein [Thermacetogeniaceae bacterium]|jgi:N-acylneuraminate cytidylyltransferase/CMP-N,N'-diacetyllegionaminic acid synthase|nr:acylneuraminate cytidylyltransferase family protein [Thermoanaerobacterales bacterium]NLN20400.1 acylneuraminate cytidylyltransferase family protein [Syntrophomonadaceae bacterium]
MYKGKRVLGFIPARAGSKGVPRKNIRLLAGKPLISYTIQAAEASGIFDFLMVSTDGKEIADTAVKAGAEVPFIRPPELATDDAKGIDVLFHAMDWCQKNSMNFHWVMLLQPTSPFRTPEDILNACEIMEKRQAEAVVSVCEVENHPWWCNTLPADHCMNGFLRPEITRANRQDLPVYYKINGAIYLAEWDFIYQKGTWYGPYTYAYIMPQERSLDIDSPIDFEVAEVLMKKMHCIK